MKISDKIKESIRKITFPLPQDQQKQGFEPNFYILSLRRISSLLILLLRLNGKNRFSNEFIQMLDPKIAIDLPDSSEKLIFRTGHGRLQWRANTLLTEEPMTIAWINSFDANDCFYDIGANVGNYSLYAAKKGVTTFAFEAEDLNVSLLYENIFLNELQDKCTPINIALGASTIMDILYLKSVSKGDALHGIGRKSYLSENSSGYKIKKMVMSLDKFIEIFNVPKPTRLKIDVDGNELQIIEGAIKTIDSVKDICIELDTKLEEHRKVFTILENKSFKVIEKETISRKWNQEISNYIFRKQ